MLDSKNLARCMRCPAHVADAWFPPLWAEMQARMISSPRRIAHFIAQIGHESMGLTRGEENMRYSAKRIAELARANGPGSRWAKAAAQADRLAGNPTALANFVYANREGNGDEASGDGWRYRARGPIGLTFHNNYADMARRIGVDIEADPDLVSTVAIGAKVACAFWNARGLNAYADRNDGLAIGRIINIGTAATKRTPNGHEDRRERTALCFKVLGVT